MLRNIDQLVVATACLRQGSIEVGPASTATWPLPPNQLVQLPQADHFPVLILKLAMLSITVSCGLSAAFFQPLLRSFNHHQA